MHPKTLNSAPPFAPWLIAIAGLSLALVLGLASATLPIAFIAVIAGLCIVLPVYILRPVWLIVPVVVFQLYFPSQPVADVVTVLLIGRAALSLIAQKGSGTYIRSHPLFWLMIVIGVCALLSFSAGIILENGKSAIYQDARIYVYGLWLIPFLAWAPKQDTEIWFSRIILAVACVVAGLAVVQGAFDIALVSVGRIGQLETLGSLTEYTRVQIPGFVFVLIGIFYCVARLASAETAGHRLLNVGLLLLFGLALIYNFGRAIWFWAVFGAAVTALCMGWRASTKILLWGLIAGALSTMALVWTKPQLADAIVERVVSVSSEGGVRSSYGWREQENSDAYKVLINSYLAGTGLGGDYRNTVPGLRGFENQTRYIHNGHLSILLKLSIFGYLAYIALFGTAIREALKLRKSGAKAPLCCAIVAWLLAFAGQNITQPDIMTAHGLTLLVMAICFLMIARDIGKNEKTGRGDASNPKIDISHVNRASWLHR